MWTYKSYKAVPYSNDFGAPHFDHCKETGEYAASSTCLNITQDWHMKTESIGLLYTCISYYQIILNDIFPHRTYQNRMCKFQNMLYLSYTNRGHKTS